MSNSNGQPRILSVEFGRKRIEYALQYSARKTLAIDVHPDLSVVATAPLGSSDIAVKQRVHKRAAWIIEQRRFFENYLPKQPPRRYVSGESYRYLGRQYRLRVQEAEADGVKMSRGQITIRVVDVSSKERVRALLKQWFRERATSCLGEVFESCATKAARCGIHAETFSIRRMKNRWGSCTKEGHIQLNPDLIVAPVTCIEYVVMHELCHLKEHNHSSRFYRLLRKVMSDWEMRREQLNRCAEGRPT